MKIGASVVVPAYRCPSCGKARNRAASTDGESREPVPGDITVCLYCAAVLTFGPGLLLERMAEPAIAALSKLERAQLRRTQSLVAVFIRRRRMH